MTPNFTSMGRRPVTLRTVLFWNMVLIALVAVAVAGSLLHFSVVRAISQAAEHEERLLAGRITRELETALMATVNLLRATAGSPSLLPLLPTTHPEIRRLYTVEPEEIQRPRSTAVALALRYFQGGGRFYIVPMRLDSGDQVVLVAVPRPSAEGDPGALVAELSPDALVAPLVIDSGDRRTAVYLAGENGRFLGGALPPGWGELPPSLLRNAAALPVGETRSVIVGESLVTIVRAPWTGWPVVVREETDVALNPVILARFAFFVLTPLALFIAALLSFRQASFVSGDASRRIERLAVAVVEAQENERRRIAQDIHDWTAQRITSSYYHVQLIEKLLAKDPAQAAKELPQLAATLDSANIELREIMRNLHPHLLNELGLAAAVKELVTDFAKSSGLEYRVSVPDGVPEPPKHIGIALFRILQEALSNVEKHAAAHRVDVELRFLADRTQLAVSDDGSGFNPGAPAPGDWGGGLGLPGMRERAELLGGEFQLASSPGRGTTVEVSIPWNLETTLRSGS